MCAALVGLCASAQEKGDMAVGLNLGVAPCLESGVSVTNFGIGAKFQYNITSPIRLEADVDYWMKNKGLDVFDISANAHYLFNVGRVLKVYPLVGLGYAHFGGGGFEEADYEEDYNNIWSRSNSDNEFDIEDSTSSGANKFLLNVGAGVELPLSDKLSVGAEIKYQYIKNFSRLPISIGIAYKF